MLQIEHINLVVNDIPETLDFYRAAFPHWQVRDEGEGEWNGKHRRWLHFGDDYQYLTFNDNGEGKARDLGGHQPGLAHFAFATSNLDALVRRMDSAGYSVDHDGGGNAYRKSVYFIDPNGIEIEIVQYVSDLPGERNG